MQRFVGILILSLSTVFLVCPMCRGQKPASAQAAYDYVQGLRHEAEKVNLDRFSFGTLEEFAQVFPDEESTRPDSLTASLRQSFDLY